MTTQHQDTQYNTFNLQDFWKSVNLLLIITSGFIELAPDEVIIPTNHTRGTFRPLTKLKLVHYYDESWVLEQVKSY